jgi:hypothetical protein
MGSNIHLTKKNQRSGEMASILFKKASSKSTRTPEGISAARVKGFTSEIYKSELRKVNHPFHRIFIVDETGITPVQHRHSKVVSKRGKKELACLTSAVLSPVWMLLDHTFTINRVSEKNMEKELWIEHRRAQLRLAIQVVGFRRKYY